MSADRTLAEGDEPASELAFDPDAVLTHVDGDRELLREIVDLFLEDSPKLLARIDAAIGDEDSDALWNSAHAIKGAISNFAAHQAFELARQLEALGRSGDYTAANETRDRLVTELERLHRDLLRFLR